MRIDPIPSEPRPATEYEPELDVEAFRQAKTVREKVRVINDVSYLAAGEAAVLFNLYAECAERGLQHLPAMEIGARFGCSTLTLALASREHNGAGLVSVDPHGWVPTSGYHPGSLEILQSNVQAAGLSNEVLPVLGRTEDVMQWWASSLCLAFIDGAHDTESTANDIRSLARFVLPGGVVCGHDYQKRNRSVADAVDEWVAQEGCELDVQQSIWIVRKGVA